MSVRPSAEMHCRNRILVVDDDPLSMELISLLLSTEGLDVIQAPNGEAAMEQLARMDEEQQPGVLLVDMHMPGLTGPPLAAHLRALTARRALLVAMSASTPLEEDLAGFDAFLPKPLDPAELRRRIVLLDSGETESQGGLTAGQTSAQAAAGPLDKGVFRKLKTAMSPAALDEVYRACVEDTRRRVPAMQQALASGELDALRAHAHSIKGGAGMVGATRLAAAAARIERGVYRLEDAPQMIDDLLTSADELEGILLGRQRT